MTNQKQDLKSIFKYWRQDILAGLSVSFVALPLSMGIALAVGYPIQAGVLAAIVGGILGFVLGGTHVGIKGPGAGAIVALITAYAVFKGDPSITNPLGVLLTCTFFAGVLLILTGVLKLGKYAQLLPSGAVNGLLAGIGFIIVVKQLDDILGYKSLAISTVDTLTEISDRVFDANPISMALGVLSILIIVYHRKIPSKTIKTIPAAIWVLLVNVALVLIFRLDDLAVQSSFGIKVEEGQSLLINIDKNVFANVNMPNFKGIQNITFWLQAISIYIILLVENLLSAKAIDKIDPLSRKTNLDKDLSSSGLTTAVSSLIGGMPSITVIARSSVNVNVGGKSRFANFTHGLVLAIVMLVAVPFINLLPKAALAAVLVVAGFRLCAPKVFNTAFKKGWEQLLIFIVTFYATLRYGLIIGILAGTVMDFSLSYFLADTTLFKFWVSAKNPYIKMKKKGDKYVLKLKGVINFFSLLKIEKELGTLPNGAEAKIDLADTQVVDRTVLEYLNSESLLYEKKGGYLDIIGLGNHHSSSPHPVALHLLNTTWKKNSLHTQRQIRLKRFTLKSGYQFKSDLDYHIGHFQTFPYFKTRPFEYKFNTINGSWGTGSSMVNFEVSDVFFHEGELSAQDTIKTTVLTFGLKKRVPSFSIEHFSLYDKIKGLAFRSDVQFHFNALDDEIQIVGENEKEIQEFFGAEIIELLSSNNAHYIESNGKEILIFRRMKLVSVENLNKLILFGEKINQLF